MPPGSADDLRRLADELGQQAEALRKRPDWSLLDRLQDAARQIERAWSGSSLGYHANVYYNGFSAPPPGASFSSEWGFIWAGDTRGDWVEFKYDDAMNEIFRRVGDPNVEALSQAASDLRSKTERVRGRMRSILSVSLERSQDAYLEDLTRKIEEVNPVTAAAAVRSMLPRNQMVCRDMRAANQGLQSAAHQDVFGRIMAVRDSARAAEELAELAEQAAEHLEKREVTITPRATHGSSMRVFIGHGQSPLWRELKDFVSERLSLEWDEFDRTPTAGVPHTERLQEMLDDAAMALLVLTAEDELRDGKVIARQNVVHEAGLFQGRLGWKRAIILLEDACEEFSNIEGLGQIRFSKGNIRAVFEEVRRVLEREGLLR